MNGLAFPKTPRTPRPRKRVPKVSKSESTKLTLRADRLARALILKRHAACQACALRAPLDVAHGWGKKAHPSVRWDGRNLFALCRNCHGYYGLFWSEWMKWMGETLGLKQYEALRAAALAEGPILKDVVAGLKAGMFSEEL